MSRSGFVTDQSGIALDYAFKEMQKKAFTGGGVGRVIACVPSPSGSRKDRRVFASMKRKKQ